jgi:Mitochondrial carrier protein
MHAQSKALRSKGFAGGRASRSGGGHGGCSCSGGGGSTRCMPSPRHQGSWAEPSCEATTLLSALQGAQATAAAIVRADGVRGLYRGFGTTIFGLVPARGVSSTLWKPALWRRRCT